MTMMTSQVLAFEKITGNNTHTAPARGGERKGGAHIMPADLPVFYNAAHGPSFLFTTTVLFVFLP